jgi:hypothetical protein
MQKLKKGSDEPKGIFSNKYLTGVMQKIIKTDESPK